MKVKDNQIRSLTQKLNLSKEENEEESIMDHVPTWDEVKALAETQGLNPLILEMPFIKTEVKKLIKGMSIEEISNNVAEIKKLMGGKGFKLGNKEGDKSETTPAGEIKLDTTNFV